MRYQNPTGSEIDGKDHVKDLGVYISSDLKFTYHIEITLTKVCGWILRTFRTRSKLVMITLFKSLIQSNLDYCNQLWSPSSQADINNLEKNQRYYTAKIHGFENLDYWRRLRELRLSSQERRRERYICIFIWKIATGKISGYDILFSVNQRRGRECQVKLVDKKAPLAVQKAIEASLSVHGAKIFNLLPLQTRNLEGPQVKVEHFKKELDNFLQSIPDEPTVAGLFRAAQTNSLLHQISMTKQINYNYIILYITG